MPILQEDDVDSDHLRVKVGIVNLLVRHECVMV
jgi:hypothetical protein